MVYVVAIAAAVCTFLFHVQSYSWSESVQLCDVCVTADEGLVSLQVPFTRLAPKETSTAEFKIYERGQHTWISGIAEKCPLRNWMSMLDAVRCPGGMFADFGFWKGGWQSESRPGSFVVVFAPAWLVGVALFTGLLAFYYRIVRFRLRSVLVAFTLVAGLLCVLTLRAPV